VRGAGSIPIDGNLPQFLSTLRAGTPAVWVFFDIFIGEHSLESPTPMIEIQDIFGEKSISVKVGEKEFIDPRIDALAYCHGLARRRCRMPSHNHPNERQPLSKWEPASIKQLDDLTSIHPADARCRRMSQHSLDLGMLQELIASPSCHNMHVSNRIWATTEASPYCPSRRTRAISEENANCCTYVVMACSAEASSPR